MAIGAEQHLGPGGIDPTALRGPAGAGIVVVDVTGAGAPTSGLGVDGNYYYDTTNGRTYGPKAAGAWPGGYTTVPARTVILRLT